jgi:xanthine dehydrogenase accessory factor
LTNVVLLRGGGDLATGVAIRLHRAGVRVLITELAQPLAVRRTVSFAEAIYKGEVVVEGITGRHASNPKDALHISQANQIPVLVDPNNILFPNSFFQVLVLIDARLTKSSADASIHAAPLVIGLGPDFTPGENCHAAVETKRGYTLGRVYWDNPPEPDTGLPEGNPARVLRAPASGLIHNHVEIGVQLVPGQLIAEVAGLSIIAPFAGVLRGLIHTGLQVNQGLKVGDVDPRNDPGFCYLVSDKALAVGGGALEAILSQSEIRKQLWS